MCLLGAAARARAVTPEGIVVLHIPDRRVWGLVREVREREVASGLSVDGVRERANLPH